MGGSGTYTLLGWTCWAKLEPKTQALGFCLGSGVWLLFRWARVKGQGPCGMETLGSRDPQLKAVAALPSVSLSRVGGPELGLILCVGSSNLACSRTESRAGEI